MPGTRIRHSKPPRPSLNQPVVIAVTSPAFQDGGEIPARHARSGGNVSPALFWSALPHGSASVALICEDPDAPQSEPFIHWVLWNVQPGIPGLPEGVSKAPLPPELPGSAQGLNDFGDIGYDGPAPPAGHGMHRYQFQIYALDEKLNLPPGATLLALRQTMKDHIVGKGMLVGLFSR